MVFKILLTPLIVRIVQVALPLLIGFLLFPLLIASALLQKSTLVWPVVAPTQVVAGQTAYQAAGWTVRSPFGWRPNPDNPETWEFHEGIDLVGPTFCDGCPVPPVADSVVDRVGWDRPSAPDPLHSGMGVVVEVVVRHPEEAGVMRIQYGHLQSYQAWVRTQTCTQEVDCPYYVDEAVGEVQLHCPGDVVSEGRAGAVWSYRYATPGACRAWVVWPEGLTPEGPVSMTFDQQIVEGEESSNAAITFRAFYPPPPTPEPTVVPTPVPLPTATPGSRSVQGER